MMKLLNVVATLDQFDPEATIYAVEPWTSASQAILVSPGPDSSEPIERNGTIYSYFLEVFIAREFLEGFGVNDFKIACDRLIQYAVNDA